MAEWVGGLPRCPQCGQADGVHSVAAIVATQPTPLAQQLQAPPPPGWVAPRAPRRRSRWWFVAAAVLFITLPVDVLVGLWLAVAFAPFLAAAFVLAALVAAIYVLLRYVTWRDVPERQAQEREHLEAARRDWQHSYAWWNQLDYCYRCHGVFLPGNEWQFAEVTAPHRVAPPSYAWTISQQLAAYVERSGPQAGQRSQPR
jgi:hypothetical protein